MAQRSGPLPFLQPAKYPDTQPVQQTPSVQVLRVPLPKRTTGGAGTTDLFAPGIPSNAVALLGVSISPVATLPTNYGICSVQVLDQNNSNPSNILDFAFGRGTKSAWGMAPLDPQLSVINIGITATDATISYNMVLYFLIAPPGTIVASIPFLTIGGNEFVISVTFTSAANTALTQDFNTLGSLDTLEILSAFFYTSGGTATGNAGYFDGTTRVDIDTTAAVASYAFNLGAKGSRAAFASTGLAATQKFRIVIGAAGVGNTSTLVVNYRAGVNR